MQFYLFYLFYLGKIDFTRPKLSSINVNRMSGQPDEDGYSLQRCNSLDTSSNPTRFDAFGSSLGS